MGTGGAAREGLPQRTADSPDDALLDFAQSTYDAASKLGKWDRAALEEIKPSLHSAEPHP